MRFVLLVWFTIVAACVTASVFPAGGAMTSNKATRIGNVTAGIVGQGKGHDEINDPVPVVLWSAKGQPAAFLYYSVERNFDARSGVQKISKIPSKGGASGDKLGSWFGGFPVVVKSKDTGEEDARHADSVEPKSILTADINGDGVDELVFARRLGGVSVYSAEKSLFEYRPQEFKHDQYNYKIMVPIKVRSEKNDVVFVLVNRSLAMPESRLPPGEKSFHEKTDNYLLLRVDGSGIVPVRLRNPWKIGSVAGVSAVSDGAGRIEELIAFIEQEGSTQLYLARHKPDGTAIGAPRKVYVSLPGYRTLEAFFAPGSSRVVMADRANGQIFFAAPGKAANWIRVVDLKKLLPGNDPALPIRAVRNGSATLVLVRQGKQVYALDDEGRFLAGRGEILSPSSERKPCMSFGTGNGGFQVVDVVAPEGGGNQLLVVETREPGARPLSDAEVAEAGKKFLNDGEYAMAVSAGKIRFGESIKYDAQTLAKKKGIGDRIESLEDVRAHLPDYYESLQSYARARFRKTLEASLFWYITGKGKTIEQGDYKRKDEYLAWAKSVRREAETVLTAFNIGGEVLGRVHLTGYFHPWTDTALWLDRVGYRGRGDHGVAVLMLKRRTFTEDAGTGYYRIDW
jgi:hypothetical protein